ncbi:MAG: hypothetical protein HY922_14955 [Elusimicrobia bacterium]|nr:hypothetical protein [Elusimicrobiota bacterium]
MKKPARKPEMSDLINMSDPEAILAETLHIVRLMSRKLDFRPIHAAFEDMINLFAGRYPGYRACNTEYHDIGHTTDTVMATLRLMHGAFAQGVRFTDREIDLGVISAIFHDSGYIQTAGDKEGTGAKYTASHVDRSVKFLGRYFRERGFPGEFPEVSASILRCTGLSVDIAAIKFKSARIELLGKMLGTGDLLGQMAARNYLEKLLFLFYEFQEGHISGFKDAFDLLKKTTGFYEASRKRLAEDLGSVNKYFRPHFRARWKIDKDLYDEAIQKHMAYLKKLIQLHPRDYRKILRREGLAEKIKKIYG